MRKFLLLALTLGFGLIAFIAFQEAKPEQKNAPIYQEIKPYSPYYLDKRFGGLAILSKVDKAFQEKPSSMEVFHRLDALEKSWGKQHLKRENDILFILDDKQSVITQLPIKTEQDKVFVHTFYGIE